MYYQTILFLLYCLFCVNCLAQQSPQIVFDAKINAADKTRGHVNVATIKLVRNDVAIDSIVTHNGRVKFKLDTGYVYKVYFGKDEYITKYLLVDTKNLPSDFKPCRLKSTMVLFRMQDHFEVDFLKVTPIGLASYSYTHKKMKWDENYSRIMIEKIVEATINYKDWKEHQ